MVDIILKQATNRSQRVRTPNGTLYAVCTTLQYFSYKPASNAAWLTVTPQSTQVMQATKTPEQIQQEAEQSGQLRPEPRFSWSYPWFTLHYILSVEDENVLDIGLAALGSDIVAPEPIFDSWVIDFIETIVNTYAISYITAEAAVLAAMWFGPHAFAVTLLVSVATKGLTLALGWNSVNALKSIFIGTWVSLILGTIGTIKMIHSGIMSLTFGFLEAASKADLWKFLYKFIYIPINMALLLMTLNRLNQLGGI